MTNLEFKILTFAKEHQESVWADILNALHPEFSYEDIGAVAATLMADGLLVKTSLVDRPPYCSVCITDNPRQVERIRYEFFDSYIMLFRICSVSNIAP